jgi:DNA-binding Lrp family transcriptional regulator
MMMPLPAVGSLDRGLLDEWQRGFPLVSRPFAVIAEHLGVTERDVIERLKALIGNGAISRIGGVVRPNTLGASTLAALAAPEDQIDAIAELLAAEPGINHVYLREGAVNLWFVVTGPDRGYVDATLHRLAGGTRCEILDLRLERPYHIDLGFALQERGDEERDRLSETKACKLAPVFVPLAGDRELLQRLTNGLPIVAEPFHEIAAELQCSEAAVIQRLETLTAAGVVPRIGVIVRHRALGWRANAMVVWDIDTEDIERAGTALAKLRGINLCYRRTRYAEAWPYNLYCMVHAKTREEALKILEAASREAGLGVYPRKVLFSLRCFKQTGALLALPREAA